jgi:mannitol-1-phosphate 5-dehydrogenase
MSLTGSRTFVGFGFGAIQTGLFLYEGFRSGAFKRLVVAEVVAEAVDAVRAADGFYTVNIAHADRVEHARVGPIEILDPGVDADCARLIEAVAQAEEISTAVPSVSFYAGDKPSSLHRILAQGLRMKARTGGPRAVIYAAENNNRAAEILEEKTEGEIPDAERAAVRDKVRYLNTVIGKMSGVVTDPDQMRWQRLTPVTAGQTRAFLVETFNRILISRIDFNGAAFKRGIDVFEEKNDLLPFEEAKLYGHNAIHALGAYLGAIRGARRIADLRDVPGAMAFLRAAFIDESGGALLRKWKGVDELFTPEGFIRYADDLLARMTNPHLQDTVERVGRDVGRKLGWDDRLIGTMRLALSQGVTPRRFAIGAAAALAVLEPGVMAKSIPVAQRLDQLWRAHVPAIDEGEKKRVCELIDDGLRLVQTWMAEGYPDLAALYAKK